MEVQILGSLSALEGWEREGLEYLDVRGMRSVEGDHGGGDASSATPESVGILKRCFGISDQRYGFYVRVETPEEGAFECLFSAAFGDFGDSDSWDIDAPAIASAPQVVRSQVDLLVRRFVAKMKAEVERFQAASTRLDLVGLALSVRESEEAARATFRHVSQERDGLRVLIETMNPEGARNAFFGFLSAECLFPGQSPALSDDNVLSYLDTEVQLCVERLLEMVHVVEQALIVDERPYSEVPILVGLSLRATNASGETFVATITHAMSCKDEPCFTWRVLITPLGEPVGDILAVHTPIEDLSDEVSDFIGGDANGFELSLGDDSTVDTELAQLVVALARKVALVIFCESSYAEKITEAETLSVVSDSVFVQVVRCWRFTNGQLVVLCDVEDVEGVSSRDIIVVLPEQPDAEPSIGLGPDHSTVEDSAVWFAVVQELYPLLPGNNPDGIVLDIESEGEGYLNIDWGQPDEED